MKIFVPHKKDPNPYLEEIIKHSTLDFEFNTYFNFKDDHKIVSVHWPEAIFNWMEPSDRDLNDLQVEIGKWKLSAKLVYTRHDHSRNMGRSVNFDKVFKLIEENADVFIHLGYYSKNQMEKKYPRAEHFLVPHPLYRNSFSPIKKNEARELLGINKESIVVIAPGRIRKKEERAMVLKAFESLPIKNKVLISNYMLPFSPEVRFRGRVKLKTFFDVNAFLKKRLLKKYSPPKFLFDYGFIPFERFSLLMSASDIVLLPRIDILNSGNLFLGLTFNKVIVGPAIGNIQEHLEKFNMPLFDPSSHNSVCEALKRGIKKIDIEDNIENKLLSEFEPTEVAKKLDIVLQQIM